MQVIIKSTESLVPYVRNTRIHSASQVVAIAASIAEFGFINPVIVREDGTIVAGHGRVLAARKLGIESVPVLEVRHLTDAQIRAYMLADNKLAEQASWDFDLLRVELDALRTFDFDLALTAFSQDEIDTLLAAAGTIGLTDPDEVPAVEENPITHHGDMWILGRHRLICGDSTNPAIVQKVLGGVRPHLMVTDPPYGVEYDPEWRKKTNLNQTGAMGKVLNDDRFDWREAWTLFPGDVAYVWHSAVFSRDVMDSLEAAEFEIRSQIIWAKPRFAISRGHYHWQHEPCWYAVRCGAHGHWQGDRTQSTLWTIAHNKSETGHGTQSRWRRCGVRLKIIPHQDKRYMNRFQGAEPPLSQQSKRRVVVMP